MQANAVLTLLDHNDQVAKDVNGMMTTLEKEGKKLAREQAEEANR